MSMNIYKQASLLKLRINTPKGPLGVESLWDLSKEALDKLALVLEKAYQESGNKSFLSSRSPKDRKAKLEFDIVLDILTYKDNEDKRKSEALETKHHNARIDDLLFKKEEEAMAGKSVKELKALRR